MVETFPTPISAHELCQRAAVVGTDSGMLLHERDAADLLKLSMRTLQAWRCRGFGPRFVKVGRAIRYRQSDIIAWIEANLVSPSGRSPDHPTGGEL